MWRSLRNQSWLLAGNQGSVFRDCVDRAQKNAVEMTNRERITFFFFFTQSTQTLQSLLVYSRSFVSKIQMTVYITYIHSPYFPMWKTCNNKQDWKWKLAKGKWKWPTSKKLLDFSNLKCIFGTCTVHMYIYAFIDAATRHFKHIGVFKTNTNLQYI